MPWLLDSRRILLEATLSEAACGAGESRRCRLGWALASVPSGRRSSTLMLALLLVVFIAVSIALSAGIVCFALSSDLIHAMEACEGAFVATATFSLGMVAFVYTQSCAADM